MHIPFRKLWLVNALAVNADVELLDKLATFPGLKAVSPDPFLRIAPEPIEDFQGMLPIERRSAAEPTWGIQKILADSVWSMGYEGKNIVIGGQDTGYDWEHPALRENYRGIMEDTVDHNYNWHDAIHEIHPLNADSINPCGLDVKMPCDDGSHGTHTMGTMAGKEWQGFNIGVAPEAKWIGCRCMERGWGTPSTYLECFQWFLAPTDLDGENPDPSLAPHVINNSWSCPEIEGCNPQNFSLLETGVQALRAAGIVVVVSAGNRGSDCSTIDAPPAIFDGSFAVGAIRMNDTIAGFSSRGPVMVDSSFRLKPDVVAPGVQVFSARPDSSGGNSSGTSMSGPHVAGLVALVLSAQPALEGDVEMIESVIRSSATPMFTEQDCGEVGGMEHPNNAYGYGIVNALDAVNAALTLSDASVSPVNDPVFIYPNPARDQITVRPNGLPIYSMRIYDQLGRLRSAMQAAPANDTYHLEITLETGIYYLALASKDHVIYRKLVVVRE
jgi:subtilisin family serine protease